MLPPRPQPPPRRTPPGPASPAARAAGSGRPRPRESSVSPAGSPPRQLYREAAPLPAQGFERDRPAVFLDDSPADRQSHPHASLSRGEEVAEEMFPVRFPDSRAGVLDDDPALPSLGGNPHGAGPSVGHRFDRLRREVEHHPFNLGRVGGNRRDRIADMDVPADPVHPVRLLPREARHRPAPRTPPYRP